MSDLYERRQRAYRAHRERVARNYRVAGGVAFLLAAGFIVTYEAVSVCGTSMQFGEACGFGEIWSWLLSGTDWAAKTFIAVTVFGVLQLVKSR